MTSKAIQIQLWQTSDGRRHDDEAFANRHERFLEISKEMQLKTNCYDVIMDLLAQYDFVKKAPAVAELKATGAVVGTCSVCFQAQYDTPCGPVCLSGHGGAESL